MDMERQFEESALKLSKKIKLVFMDGEEGVFKYKSMSKYNLLVEGDNEVLFVPKHSVKYYIIKGYEPESKKIKIEKIVLTAKMQKTPIDEEKVAKLINYYKKHKMFNNLMTVRKRDESYILTDGLSRYTAAKRLGIGTVDVRVEKDLN